MRTFEIGDRDFLLDGEPFQIISGALHYFRVHPDQWSDRIVKARQMGLNTIETYVPWNAHEPHRGAFDASGQLDLARFLDEVHEQGMLAIVRPGPYICAEWTNGGLPSWLFLNPDVGIRRNEPEFMAAIEQYFAHIGPIIAPRQIDRGGPVILVQIENEYGAYGSDKAYLRRLVEINRAAGFTVPFTTVDQPTDQMLEDGSLPELHKTASFGSRAADRLAILRAHQPVGPLMCSELWNGWFDHWGSHHHVAPADVAAEELDALLSAGASVNLYMFHGGTNFGFSSGANDKGIYRPTVTSYDYDAPLDEGGNPTPKYTAFRDVISRYALVDTAQPSAAPSRLSVPVCFDRLLPLAEATSAVGTWVSHASLVSMDDVARYDGFLLYRTDVASDSPSILSVEEVRDRAQIMIDGTVVATLSRENRENAALIPAFASGSLQVLVEDQGRVNYGPRLGEKKGLIAPLSIGGTSLSEWEVAPLLLENISEIELQLVGQAHGVSPDCSIGGPSFALATFDIEDEPLDQSWFADRYLDTTGMGKGVAWINGFCLGRYWSRGPQLTLFVPGPILRASQNTLVIFEQLVASPHAALRSDAQLGPTEL